MAWIRFIALCLVVINAPAAIALFEQHQSHSPWFYFTNGFCIFGLVLYTLGARGSRRMVVDYWHQLLVASLVFASLRAFIKLTDQPVDTVVTTAVTVTLVSVIVLACYAVFRLNTASNQSNLRGEDARNG